MTEQSSGFFHERILGRICPLCTRDQKKGRPQFHSPVFHPRKITERTHAEDTSTNILVNTCVSCYQHQSYTSLEKYIAKIESQIERKEKGKNRIRFGTSIAHTLAELAPGRGNAQLDPQRRHRRGAESRPAPPQHDGVPLRERERARAAHHFQLLLLPTMLPLLVARLDAEAAGQPGCVERQVHHVEHRRRSSARLAGREQEP